MNRFYVKLNNNEFLFFDGAMGTQLTARGLKLGKVPELLNLTNREEIIAIHKDYIEAGSDIISTCTFGVNRLKLEGTGKTVDEVIGAAIINAREAAKGTDTLVALDIGPCGRMLEPNGNLTFEEAYELYKEQIIAGKDADLVILETMTDLYELKAAVLAAKENSNLPIVASMTFEANHRTFTGTQISSMAITLEGLGVDAVGMNCSLGPAEFAPLIEELSKWTNLPILSMANAGLPDPETGSYNISAEEFAQLTKNLIPYGVKLAGGCCGTTPEFIKALRKAFDGEKYQKQNPEIPAAVCTPEKTVVIDQPRVIGERINPTGKKKLKAALKEGDMDYILGQAADQIRDGAEILDVNVGVPDINEKEVIVNIVKALQGITNAPLQIDSNNPETIEAALRVYSGKAIVNSVNGEEKSLETILPIVKKYGASVVGLTLDEDGIPKTVEKRIEIAEKIMNRAIACGIRKEDIYIDCLTLTVSAEQENAANTLYALRYVKEKMGLKTVLGVSNISFGLPNRPIVNHNFLQMALMCGLDLPIMNPGSAEMMQAVDVYRLIMNHDRNSINYLNKYSGEIVQNVVQSKLQSASKSDSTKENFDEIKYAIDNGLESKVRELVLKELETRDSMDVINNTLIPVLDKAGADFEAGIIFLPQLILCASAAQAGFDAVKEKILASGEKREPAGKIVIATVKGDVHDIGKNIVKVILENYGYECIDLGKDVPPEAIAEAVSDKTVRLCGLSALMTTTLGSMEESINMIRQANSDCKIMVGGAVLTEDYAKKIGADFFVKDAKESVDAAKKVY